MSIALRLFVRLSLVSCLVSTVPSDAAAQPSTAAGGGAFTLVVKSDGTLWAFGLNNNGQIGDNTLTTRKSPQQVSGLSSIQTVAAGSVHDMALTASGSLYVWGDNLYGQVGDASTTDRKTPVLLSLSNVTAIAAGEFHSLALTSSGNLYAWGRNNFGQIGNGNTTNVSTPTLVLSDVVAIGAGRNHSLAVKSDGTAWAWGANGSGQLGTNTTSTGATSTPVQMLSVSGASQIVGGEAHSFIVLNDGTLKGAGENGAGQLADGTLTDRWTAITIGALSNVAQVASGLDHAFARLTDGSVFGWGENTGGELGLGANTTDQKSPVEITTLSGISTIAAGWSHSIAIDSMGVVSTWGANAGSQLGDGTVTARTAPVPISEASYAWRVATPVFSVAAGTYNVDKTVVVTVDTAGATIRYTQNGDEPTESDPTVTSGASVTVTSSQTLKAKAWKSGMPAGETAVALYTLKVATPTVSPTATTYTTAQNVTMATTTPGSTLRYTIDGTDPTESSTAYSGAINTAHTTTYRIVGFKSGWSPSDVRVSTYTMNFGTLAAPTVDPATGAYTGSVSVTMSSPQNGATIRYTTNNTAPTATSAAYTGAITLGVTTTVRAKVFHPDYTASAETSRTYTLTAHTPTLDTAAGSYAPGSTVTVTAGQPTDTLRMTIDGTEPTTTSPVIASGTSIALGQFTLKVKAWRTGATDSAVAGATYTLTAPMGPGSAAAGGTHTVIATPDGRVVAWGANANGQLGIESTTGKTTPTTLNTITGVVQIAGGTAHTLARTWDGQLYAWGNNGSGRLGDGTTTQRTKPTLIASMSNVISIAAGNSHSLALTSDGQVYAWGSNASGELGLGNTTATSTPTLIPTLSNIVAIAAGTTHSFAVTSSGQLYAWGSNASSRLGDGTTTNRTSPVLINLSDVVAVAAGAAHSAALTSSGAVYAWGLNTNGQLGLGNTMLKSTPTLIPSLHASAIAAGDNFSAALRGDGVLVAWGLNSSGQLGDTTTTQRTSPVVVSGPSSVSSLAMGAVHSIAVTPQGDAWTWGAGASGQLGDGGTANRSTPQAVLTGIPSWAPAAPSVSVPSQTLTSAQAVTLTSTSPGAVIRYNLLGVEPTTADAAVPEGGEVQIEFSSLLRAKAFVEGRTPGATVRADYELQSMSPTIDPPTGTYSEAQTVTLTVSGPPSVIRYTVDGSDPTTNSTEYTSSFVVTTTTIIKARAFPTNGWAASGASTAGLTFNYGTLELPAANPGGGVFAAAPEVTLTSIGGATIRYTVNGSTPTGSSPLYTGPITIAAGGQTIKSIAFHPDWSTSAVRTDTYTVDTVAPTITASSFPAAVGGWHGLATTVTFTCGDNVGIASCSGSSSFTAEGQGQTIVGTAVDLAGRETTTNVTVNVDWTPPSVSLTSPSTATTTTSTSMTLEGEVSDQLSGLSTVTCNGEAATVVAGAVSCEVALHPGINDLVLAARDAAGNSRSAGVRVIRTGTSNVLSLAPAMQTLLVDEAVTLQLTDDFGATTIGATWESSDPEIVSVSEDDPPVLTALAAGTATITATKNALTAQATLAVVVGPLASGTTRWAMNGVFGDIGFSLPANRVDLSVPDLFTVESGATGTIVRGVTAGGVVQWVAQSPGYPVMADSFGAIVAGLPAPASTAYWGEPFQSRFGGYVRFAGPENVWPWRYDSVGRIEQPAQAPDGTIYALEKYDTGLTDVHGMAIVETQAIVLDGATGQVRSKMPLSREVLGSACGNEGWVVVPKTIGPVVGHDGYGYLLVRSVTNVRSGGCGMTGVVSQDVGVKLLRLSPAGAAVSTPIYSQHCDRGFSNYTTCMNPPNLGELVPDGVGGMLVHWGYTTAAINDHTFTTEARLTRVTPEGIQYDILFGNSELSITSEGGVAFVTDYAGGVASGVRAVNVVDWTTVWSDSNPSLLPVTALADGGVAMFDVTTNSVIAYGSDGMPGASAASDWYWGYLGNQSAFGLWTRVQFNGPAAGQLTANVSLPLNEANGSFLQRSGVGPQQNAPRRRSGLDSVAAAALAAFDFFQLHVRSTPWEWGGVICPQNGRFTFSRIVTDHSNGSVRTVAAPGMTAAEIAALPSCGLDGPMSPVGAFHFHTMDIAGQPYPSGYGPSPGTPNDLNTAALRPELTFFVQTPVEGDSSYTRTLRYMYQAEQVGTDSNGDPIWNAYYNTFKWVNRQWVHFDPPAQ